MVTRSRPSWSAPWSLKPFLNNIVFIVALVSMIKIEISSDVGVFVPKAPILHLWHEKVPEILCILSGYSALAKYRLGGDYDT